jgi:TnpA family transposase
VPVEFLTDEQAEAYGKFAEEPTRPELERFFFLDDEDRKLIAKRRGDHSRLGFAVQICTVRYVGLFPDDPLAVPWAVVEHLAEQLEIEDVSCVKEYTERLKTAYEHAWEIRDAYGYHPYEDHDQGRKFRSFLHGRAWTAHAEGPKALFDHAVGWLRRNRVLLPGVSVLARQVAEVLAFADKRLHTTVAKEVRRADAALPGDLVATLKTPEGRRYSELELIEQTGCDVDVGALWRALEEVAPRAALSSAAVTVVSLVPEGDDTAETALRSTLALRYNTVKPFLSLLGESKALDAAPGGRRILTGVQRLPALARRKVGEKPLLPREVDDKLVPAHWRKAVYANADLPEGAVDRDAYVVCVLEQLFGALKRRDIFASPSHRWSDPRARLLTGKSWEAVRKDVLAGLSLEEDAERHLRELVDVLDATWKQMAERLEEAGDDAKISIEVQSNGRAKLNVEKLHALGEPKSLKWLRERVEKMLPKTDLSGLLFEVNGWTGFLDAFVHLGDGRTRMKDLTTSMVALLVSEACNIGMTPVINPGYEALTRSRLVHVDQYYLRSDTIAAANAALIEAQARVPIVQFWGKGLLASVDGLRFVVPTRSINAAPSPKYFAKKKGITWLNAINDQVIGIGQMVVPGTPRDSLFILDALLNLDGGVRPEMVATDNAS